MYAILGEDTSDTETLKELVFRIAQNRSLTIKSKGYSSCGEMLRKGNRQLKLFQRLGAQRFIICYDADRDCPVARRQKIIDDIITPANFNGIFCALVPIQELESWILADIHAVQNIIKGWAPGKAISNPESINDPKEHLEKLSRTQQQRPRYSHAIHNPQIAKHLNIATILAKCSSFKPLFDIVSQGVGNVKCTVSKNGSIRFS